LQKKLSERWGSEKEALEKKAWGEDVPRGRKKKMEVEGGTSFVAASRGTENKGKKLSSPEAMPLIRAERLRTVSMPFLTKTEELQ